MNTISVSVWVFLHVPFGFVLHINRLLHTGTPHNKHYVHSTQTLLTLNTHPHPPHIPWSTTGTPCSSNTIAAGASSSPPTMVSIMSFSIPCASISPIVTVFMLPIVAFISPIVAGPISAWGPADPGVTGAAAGEEGACEDDRTMGEEGACVGDMCMLSGEDTLSGGGGAAGGRPTLPGTGGSAGGGHLLSHM